MPKDTPALYGVPSTWAHGPGRRDEDPVRAVEPGSFADFVDGRGGRVARRRELTLDDPESAVLDAENVGSAVAAAADEPNVVETVADEETRDVTFEGLPGSSEKPTGVEEWLVHFNRPRRISAVAASKPRG